MHCRFVSINPVDILYPSEESSVAIVVQHVPIQADIVIPLSPLPISLPMNNSFLPAVHTYNRAAIGDWQTFASRLPHFCQKGAFSMHDLVVGKRHNEIFGKGIKRPESEFVVVELAMDRIKADIFQRIVHPAISHLKPKPSRRRRSVLLPLAKQSILPRMSECQDEPCMPPH